MKNNTKKKKEWGRREKRRGSSGKIEVGGDNVNRDAEKLKNDKDSHERVKRNNRFK